MGTLPPPGPRHRILVVDDEEDTRMALVGWFAHDYDVMAAADGIEGLELATQPPPPDLVLVDVWMPRLDGISMVKQMKQIDALRHVPVIFLTGQMSTASMLAGIAAGARAYLPKPIDVDLLDRKVKSALLNRSALEP
jgi:sigma-B regulation protein RsbU (phosphoserine phosphatase)